MCEQCDAQEPPPPPPPIETSRSIWEPGGDPAALRAAARAWRSLGATLTSIASEIDGGAQELLVTWTGDAAEGFDAYWRDLHGSLGDGAAHAEEVATQLEEIADEIERVNEEVRELYLAIAATAAVSIAASFVTFGLSTAAGAAAAAANVARATTLVNGLATFLRSMQFGFSVSRLTRFWRLWAFAAGANTGATTVVKAFQGELDSWTPRDLSGIVVNSTTGVGAMGLMRPGLVAAGSGSAAGSVTSDVWLDGRSPFDPTVLRNMAINGVTGAAAAGAANRGLDAFRNARAPRLGDPIAPELTVAGPGGTARSIDDLWLPGRPPTPPPAPPSPTGPHLWLPGEQFPRPIIPSRPVTPTHVDSFDAGGNLVGNATGNGLTDLTGGGPPDRPPLEVDLPPLPLVGAR